MFMMVNNKLVTRFTNLIFGHCLLYKNTITELNNNKPNITNIPCHVKFIGIYEKCKKDIAIIILESYCSFLIIQLCSHRFHFYRK